MAINMAVALGIPGVLSAVLYASPFGRATRLRHRCSALRCLSVSRAATLLVATLACPASRRSPHRGKPVGRALPDLGLRGCSSISLPQSAAFRIWSRGPHRTSRCLACGCRWCECSGRPRRVLCGFRRCCRPWWLALHAREQLSGFRISQEGYRLAGAVDGHRRRGTQTAVPDHRCVCATDHRDVSARR
jgi:hypothetical protein